MSHDNDKKNIANSMSTVYITIVTVILVVAAVSGYQAPQEGITSNEQATLVDTPKQTA